MNSNEVVIDTWAALSHKAPLAGTTGISGRSWVAPSWTGIHSRRLAAYKVLSAYLSNVAREFLTGEAAKAKDRHVEFGDPATLRNAIVGTLLGDEQTIVVDGADEDLPSAPDEAPATPGVDEPNTQAETATAIEQERGRIMAARDRQEWLRDWADTEHLVRKVFETEGKAVGLGDGVYVMRWSSRKKRPIVRIYDPGFYFPVLSMHDEEEYPTTVHLAWEYDEDHNGTTQRWVRRITYRLAPIGEATQNRGMLATITSALGTHVVDATPRNVTVNQAGKFTRQYAWNAEPSEMTVYLTDAKWRLEDVGKRYVSDLDPAKAEYELNEDGVELKELDIELDFIPVVHLPNTVAEEEHYGKSALLDVAQILDEIAGADTDLSAAAATTGSPMIGLTGGQVGSVAYGPGKVWNLAAGGRVDVVDTSKALDALLKYVESLLHRLSTNARVPASVLGRIDPSEIASGVLLALSFGPLKQLITEMRLVRDEKYPLILKFAQRLAMAGGELDGEVLHAELRFGSFMPHDRAEAVQLVRSLLGNGQEPAAISRMTALRLLVDAGFDLGDAMDELERIEAEDFVGAEALLRATGDEGAVFDYLGRVPTPGSQQVQPTLAPNAAQSAGGFTPQLPGAPNGAQPPADQTVTGNGPPTPFPPPQPGGAP